MGNQYIILFGIIFTGYLVRRIGLINSGMNYSINRFVIYFTFPCLILDLMTTSKITDDVLLKFFQAFILSIASFAVYSVIAYLYTKIRKFKPIDANVSEFAMVSPNNGFIGFPITLAFLGNIGLLYMVSSSITLNLYLFSYGTILLNRNNRMETKLLKKDVIRKIINFIKNPNILSVIFGIIFAIKGITLPEPMSEYLHIIGGLSTPLAMLMIGSSLAENKFLDIIKDKVAVETTIMKLIFMPLITLGLVYFLPFDSKILAMLVLAAAMPTAATVFMLTQHKEQNYQLAGNSIFLTTLFSIVTIPLFIEIIDRVIL